MLPTVRRRSVLPYATANSTVAEQSFQAIAREKEQEREAEIAREREAIAKEKAAYAAEFKEKEVQVPFQKPYCCALVGGGSFTCTGSRLRRDRHGRQARGRSSGGSQVRSHSLQVSHSFGVGVRCI